MKTLHNQIFEGANKRKSLYSLTEVPNASSIVIFVHGYKGYKDWGAWNILGEMYAKSGVNFLSFNFSHNGGTVENPIDFPDLDAFSENRYSYEVEDLDKIVSLVRDRFPEQKIFLIGHSRGGGIVSLFAKDNRIAGIITLAAVADFKERFPKGEHLESWKNEGVYFVKNGRTKQDMPHKIAFYKDFEANEKQLTISNAVKNASVPFLVIHGSADEAVTLDNAERLAKWSNTTPTIIQGAGHTFQTSHPWQQPSLSEELTQVFEKSLNFILNA